jgi:hypothetical protein
MKKNLFLLISIFVLFSQTRAFADTTIVFPNTFTVQSDFRSLSKEVGLAIAVIPMEPAAPMGILGFDIGVEASVVSIHNNDPFWSLATNGSAPSSLIIPKLHINKGLPANIDIGLVYSSVPNSNVSLIGGDLKFAILEGSVATPAVALRGSFSKLNGVPDLTLSSATVDLSISKGIGPVTPYAGVEEVFIQSTATNAALNLTAESIQSFKGFIGAKFSLVFLNLVGQVDMGELPMYTLRLNLGW